MPKKSRLSSDGGTLPTMGFSEVSASNLLAHLPRRSIAGQQYREAQGSAPPWAVALGSGKSSSTSSGVGLVSISEEQQGDSKEPSRFKRNTVSYLW